MAAKKPTEKPADAEVPAVEETAVEKPVVKGESAEVRKLRGELAAAQARLQELEAPAAPGKSKKQPLPEKYKGMKRYKLTAPCYRKGLLEAGAVIVVTDTIPSKTWVEVDTNNQPIEPDDAEEAE